MIFKMPQYEVKYHEEDEWQEISELDVIGVLYKTFKKTTPAILEMMSGKEVETPDAVYRLKDQNNAECSL